MSIPILRSGCGSLQGILYQSYTPKVLNAAIEIGVFEVLANSHLTLAAISDALQTDSHITEGILDVLITVDLIEKKNDVYRLTLVSKDYLLKDAPASQLGAIQRYSGSAGPFDRLVEIVKTGSYNFDFGIWSTKESISGLEQFNRGGIIQAVLTFVRSTPEFENCSNMCDFAGSSGYFSYAFLHANPNLRSHVYDLPKVCVLAKEMKREEEDFDRVTYHGIDINADESFGGDYDFFFSSQFLYEFNYKNTLGAFFRRVNASMKPGGLLVSNHVAPSENRREQLNVCLLELMTRVMGYPTHQLPEEDLKEALSEAGFGRFRTEVISDVTATPYLLLSAVKLRNM